MNIKNIKNTISNLTDNSTTGEKLKNSLGIPNIPYVYLQKIINLSLNMYIVTYNSRYPNLFITYQELKTLKHFTTSKVKKVGGKLLLQNFKITPPIPIENYDTKIDSDSIIVRVDLAGEKYRDSSLYESSIEYQGSRLKLYE